MCKITKENDSLQRQTENKDEDSQKIQGNKNIPELRFPEFEGEWKEVQIKDIANIVGGGTPSTKNKDFWNGKINWFTPTEVGENKYLFNSERKITEKGLEKSSATLLPINTILLTTRATIGRRSIILKKSTTNQGFQSLTIKNNSNVEFIYYLLDTLKKILLRKSCGSTFLELSKKELKKINIIIPIIEEQEKIANFLSAIDKKIGFMEKIVENFLSYHKYIIQHLPLDPHNLIKKEGWQLLYLNEILFEHKLKSNGFEEVFSVSVEKGLINQIEHLGRSFSAKNTDKYNLVKYGDIVYTKSPTGDFPLGIIKQSHVKNNVIVSPLYGIFTPKTFELGYILENYFKYPVNCHNYLHSIVQKGAKNTMNITNKTFLSKQLYLPTNINEQKRIFNILYSLNRKIDLISDEIKEMREFKKGLLQKMFC